MVKIFLAAAFLAAVSIPASAGQIADQASGGNRAFNYPHNQGRNGNLQISDQASGGVLSRGSRTIARNHNPNSIYDRWGNLRGGRDTDAFPLPRKHSYRGTVTLVR